MIRRVWLTSGIPAIDEIFSVSSTYNAFGATFQMPRWLY